MTDSSNSKTGEGRGVCLGGRLRDSNKGRVRLLVDSLSLLIPSSRLPEGLMSLDIEIILNRRNCMVATLQIIKKNFPEVRPGTMIGGGTDRAEGRFVPEALDSNLQSMSFSPKAVVVELVQEQTEAVRWPV